MTGFTGGTLAGSLFLKTTRGKKSYGWGSAGWDVLRMTNDSKIKSDFISDVNKSLREGRFEALFLSSRETDYLHLDDIYCYKETILSGVWNNPIDHGKGAVKVYIKCSPH